MVLLRINKLAAKVGDKDVLRGLDLTIGVGEVHALMGANGSGKTSLTQVLMGSTQYVTQNAKKTTVLFNDHDLLAMTSDERARAGLYVAWQSPITIPGVTVFSLCKASYEATGHTIAKLTEFKQLLETLAERVGLTKAYISRNVNEGFSGGERKRLELLQLLLLLPKLAILDEIDSGLDASGITIVAKIIAEMKELGTSFILITHSKRLLDELVVDKTWEMCDGTISTGI